MTLRLREGGGAAIARFPLASSWVNYLNRFRSLSRNTPGGQTNHRRQRSFVRLGKKAFACVKRSKHEQRLCKVLPASSSRASLLSISCVSEILRDSATIIHEVHEQVRMRVSARALPNVHNVCARCPKLLIRLVDPQPFGDRSRLREHRLLADMDVPSSVETFRSMHKYNRITATTHHHLGSHTAIESRSLDLPSLRKALLIYPSYSVDAGRRLDVVSRLATEWFPCVRIRKMRVSC